MARYLTLGGFQFNQNGAASSDASLAVVTADGGGRGALLRLVINQDLQPRDHRAATPKSHRHRRYPGVAVCGAESVKRTRSDDEAGGTQYHRMRRTRCPPPYPTHAHAHTQRCRTAHAQLRSNS